MNAVSASPGNLKTECAELALNDSRRLTGPNLLSERPGAIIEVACGGYDVDIAVSTWQSHARRILDAVGWAEEETFSRLYSGGASLAFSAPVDALYAATEVNEWAWEAAAAELQGAKAPDLEAGAERLRELIGAESNPDLIALRDAARQRRVRFLTDDNYVSVGSGIGSIGWSLADTPAPEAVPWDRVRDVPVALVTGSNGKTTTVRLLAAMAQAAGLTAGFSCTDGIVVGGISVDEDDWSGPGGARTVLRDRRVETAILETARGGILRRGLGVDRAEAAAVTNVAADHLGEYGVEDVDSIADAKLVVRHAVQGSGPLVINAEDETLARHAEALGVPITWFGVDPGGARIRAQRSGGGGASFVENGHFVFARAGCEETIAEVEAVPLTFGGKARYNIENVLAAIPLARALEIPIEAVRSALAGFDSRSETNPGRGNFFKLGGIRVLVDFVHNPHGMRAITEMVKEFSAQRILLVLGQAGDRDDDSIRALVDTALQMPLDHIIIKEMKEYLRGRAEGVVPALIEEELRGAGFPADRISHAFSELEAVSQALEWARPGDFLVLPVHGERREVLELLKAMETQ